MKFTLEETIRAPAEALFGFHADPARLSGLLQGWPGFRLLHHTGAVRNGCTTWIEQTVTGLPIVLGLDHTIHEPPRRLGARLIHGPFDRFDVVREFEERESATVVRDAFDVCLAWPYGGEIATRRLVAPRIRRAVRFSHRRLTDAIGVAGR